MPRAHFTLTACLRLFTRRKYTCALKRAFYTVNPTHLNGASRGAAEDQRTHRTVHRRPAVTTGIGQLTT